MRWWRGFLGIKKERRMTNNDLRIWRNAMLFVVQVIMQVIIRKNIF